jgi:hypothetical protein
VLAKERPVAVEEKTINKRVSGVTGIDSPVVRPLETLPIAIIPVNAGANVTTAPGIGVNKLSGVGELYNCAVTVTVDPVRANAAVLLK